MAEVLLAAAGHYAGDWSASVHCGTNSCIYLCYNLFCSCCEQEAAVQARLKLFDTALEVHEQHSQTDTLNQVIVLRLRGHIALRPPAPACNCQ
jgi:hypothetical protein